MPRITIQQLLLRAQQKIDPLDAELLIAHVLKKPREWVLAHCEFQIEDLRLKIIKKFLARRASGEPMAYLTGHKEFFGLDFVVNKHVLIPRPDTELLVETAIEEIKKLQIADFKFQNTILIDVGTGSGCIPISITKTLKQKNIKTFAIDISAKALTVARQNARKHHVAGKIKLLRGDLLSPILKSSILNPLGLVPLSHHEVSSGRRLKSSIIITANLPYLTQRQYQNSPSIQYEPKRTLVAKNGGLELYEKLLKQIHSLFCNLKSKICIFFEIDPSQTEPIKFLINILLPDAKIQIKKDLAGLDRVVQITHHAA
jgi:release factor glutamine methyltransferase